ncbi:TonB-dependent receptor domain-containing protein [Sphingomonas quercus]|uniref:TonB-dependent receptor n=1 Tax=Sphingomonas quercus TaxID=2842451 RepID=A0ABS6BFI1_9SPHN|nr:TonB-dependent receptor [Sphingomonas quercus]MBU3077043.1 TonB-dependent receptor [Sphingomonas quercus]
MTRSFKHYARLALRTGAAPVALGAALIATPGFAQETPAAAADAAGRPEEIIVTGSLFRRAIDTETASPVTMLTTDTLAKAGVTDVSQAVRSIAADGAGSIASTRSSFSGGASTVSLRNVGAGATLTLIDGLRSVGFPMNDDGHISFVDLNSVPFSAVQEIQVLKDGASSLYGADAIGGVVNIILKKRFTGVAGQLEGGATTRGDGQSYRANLTVGFGDYESQGWNLYVNGEYQLTGRVSNHDVGFPYNTADISSIGGLDRNSADDTLSTATPDAKVRRVNQINLNDPFNGSGLVAPSPTGTYTTLTNLANCSYGTFTVAGAAGGTGCKHNITDEYGQIVPKQERYSVTAHLAARLSDTIEAHLVGSYSRSVGDYINNPTNIAQVQPYRGPTTDSSQQIALPVYVCAAGVNCVTAADRRLNPNNPYAAAYANDPANGAARIYYLFGDIQARTRNVNEVYRANAGLEGSFGEDWNWKADIVAAKDVLNNTNYGTLDIAGLRQVINTGAYNFVNPSLNTQAVRDIVAPVYTSRNWTSMVSFDASLAKSLMELPGGPLQVAVGGQVRREVQHSPGMNPDLTKFATTAGAFGKHTVSAGFFEVSAPVLPTLELTGSGRYDNYSEGFSAFSPKVGATFKPIRQVMLRGTWSRGFRAPSFAERDPTSGFSGSFTVPLPEAYIAAHGGPNAAYVTASRSARGGFSGNPDLKPEKSRSFTVGTVISPTRDFDLTVDYYNIKKTDVIVMAPRIGEAFNNYYTGQALPPNYVLLAVGEPDPLFPNALPRATLIASPFGNSASEISTGIDFSAAARIGIADGIKLNSTVNGTYVLEYSTTTAEGIVQKFEGTKGPSALSAGAGTPKWRANWQNSLQIHNLTLSTTTYFVGRIKNVAADSGSTDLSCAHNLYGTGDKFCYIGKFIYTDLNASFKVNDQYTFYINVGNFTNEKAPIAAGGSNFIATWHLPGVVGRTFRVGAKFGF